LFSFFHEGKKLSFQIRKPKNFNDFSALIFLGKGGLKKGWVVVIWVILSARIKPAGLN